MKKAWENYWVACNAEYQEAKLVWMKDSLQVQRLRREQHGIVKKMKKWFLIHGLTIGICWIWKPMRENGK